MHLLQFNVYFKPVSFGGATIVAENMAKLLTRNHDWQVTTVTTTNDPARTPYSILRYRTEGMDVIAINVPENISPKERYWNYKVDAIVSDIVRMVSPDVAHVHCVQNMSAGILRELKLQGIPTALTIHDCWWLCERQFMINSSKRYCFQEKIDFEVCRYCVPEIEASKKRLEELRSLLSYVDLLLFPSEFHKSLHIANGFPHAKCMVNKNGVSIPLDGYTKETTPDPETRVRFGFTGGPGPIKGSDLIVRSLANIDRADYEMIVVDAAQNLGRSWAAGLDWDVKGKLTVAPAYNQDTLDQFFSKIDVLLFPSQWKESFGLTVREALARDVWVIATDGGGTIEDCVEGDNSTILPLQKDYTHLRDAMLGCFDKDWQSYKNPHKEDIVSIEKQASQLAKQLTGIKK